MDIRNTKELKRFAGDRLDAAPQAGRILLVYAALTVGLAVVATCLNFLLSDRIDQTGGLSNMGTRTVLSAIQTMLPMVQSMLLLCVDLGLKSALLRIARGQYASPNSLRLGFDRFWPLLRLTLLRGGFFLALGMLALYAGVILFAMTPLVREAEAVLAPVMEGGLVDPSVLMDQALYDQLLKAVMPAVFISLGIYGLMAVPMWFRFRLADYLLIDNPGWGAMVCLRTSRMLMYRRCLKLLRVDLSLWYYYIALVLATVVAYGDVLLPMLGVALPFPEEVSYFLFYGLYLAAQVAIYYYLRGKAEVVLALAYDSLKPKAPENGGVVLGSIFDNR